jgi:hypothetical protein
MNSLPSQILERCLPCYRSLQVYTEFVYLKTKSSGMTRQLIIERTIKAINLLPEDKAEEISDFADFVMKRYEEHSLAEGIKQLISNSSSFDFLKNEEDLYSEADLKELYNG